MLLWILGKHTTPLMMTSNYLYPYQIVHFIHDQNENGTRSIEFVPNSWIEFDSNTGCIMARYMEGPYTEEDKVLIRTLIKKEMSAPEDAENDGKAKSAATVQYYKDANSNHVLTKNEIVSNLLAKNNLPTDSEKSDDVSDKE
ncbi:hypothetical protein PV327_010942, partial [Microctonus hyperodae]